MTVQKRPFISYEKALELNLTLPDPTKISANGLNGYPLVFGAALLSENSVYGFSTSHSALLNILDLNQYEIMIIRNSNYYDDKGITDPMMD